MRLLAVGDIHLGKHPSRVPETLRERVPSLSPREAWFRSVQLAINESVDSVLLAGDVVDDDHAFFDAYSDLAQGARQLASANIPVFAVVGNHDHQVLPRLAREIDNVNLVGYEQTWERIELQRDPVPVFLWGWSFDSRFCHASPLSGHMFEREHGVHLGLLHCDRDATGSPYAPVTSAELAQSSMDAWFLGHIHAPDDLNPDHPWGYLGSVSSTHPGESGARGPWLVEINDSGRITRFEHIALSPMRWENRSITITPETSPEDAESLVVACITSLDAELARGRTPPTAVGVRLTINGRHPAPYAVEAALLANSPILIDPVGATTYFVDSITVTARPALDLTAISCDSGPLGILSRTLLGLDADDPISDELVNRIARRLERELPASQLAALGVDAVSAVELSELASVEGYRLLDAMAGLRGGSS